MGEIPLDQRLGDEASLEGYRSEEARREAIYGFVVSGIDFQAIADRFACSPADIHEAAEQARAFRPYQLRRENGSRGSSILPSSGSSTRIQTSL